MLTRLAAEVWRMFGTRNTKGGGPITCLFENAVINAVALGDAIGSVQIGRVGEWRREGISKRAADWSFQGRAIDTRGSPTENVPLRFVTRSRMMPEFGRGAPYRPRRERSFSAIDCRLATAIRQALPRTLLDGIQIYRITTQGPYFLLEQTRDPDRHPRMGEFHFRCPA
jgi:hypothetical protein